MQGMQILMLLNLNTGYADTDADPDAINLNTGYADTDADLCIRIMSVCYT